MPFLALLNSTEGLAYAPPTYYVSPLLAKGGEATLFIPSLKEPQRGYEVGDKAKKVRESKGLKTPAYFVIRSR
jgi:hypothetical protein